MEGVVSRVPLAVDVALAPMLLRHEPALMERTVYIVVDVIRATTTLCVLFERGCRQVNVAGSIAAAREAARQRKAAAHPDHPAPLLAGEMGGLAPSGFDFGNSPAEFAALDLHGRDVIFATTNGTRALHACVGGGAVLVGAFRNATAVAQAAVALAAQFDTPAPSQKPAAGIDAAAARDATEASIVNDPDDPTGPAITVVCAGRDQRPAFDDTICAGYLALAVERAAASAGQTAARTSGARIAIAATESALRDGPRAALAQSDAARATIAVGLVADLDWCAAIDACPLVPAVAPEAIDGELLVVRPWVPL